MVVVGIDGSKAKRARGAFVVVRKPPLRLKARAAAYAASV
jgi:hypothetical protein